MPAAGGDTWSLATSLNGGSPEARPVRRLPEGRDCYSVEQVEYGSSYRDENTQEGLSGDQLAAYYDEAGAIARSFRFTDTTAQ
jgi:hypothetical protein